MCTPNPNPKAPAPPAPPAPIAPKASEKLAPVIAGRTTARDKTGSRRVGRNSLRIDLNAGNAGAGGTGLNIPRV